jgi:hypothetical protein
MAQPGDAGLVYACVTHVPLWVQYPSYVTTIHLGDAQRDGALNLRDLAPEWEPYHPLLGGTSGTFALKNLVLQHHPRATSIGICQYRKFVSRERIHRNIASRYRVMDMVPKAMLSPELLTDVMRPREPFLLAKPFTLSKWRRRRDYLKQYGRAHRAMDLLRFTAEAVEQGVLDNARAIRFLGEDMFMAGGVELGVFPAEFWLPTVTAIESVVRECIRRYRPAPEGYQRRAWAFCTERLGSYLLLQHLRAMNGRQFRLGRLAWAAPSHWSRRFVGQLNLIIEEGATNYVRGR